MTHLKIKTYVFIRNDGFFYFYVTNIPIFLIDTWSPLVKTIINGRIEIDNLVSLIFTEGYTKQNNTRTRSDNVRSVLVFQQHSTADVHLERSSSSSLPQRASQLIRSHSKLANIECCLQCISLRNSWKYIEINPSLKRPRPFRNTSFAFTN